MTTRSDPYLKFTNKLLQYLIESNTFISIQYKTIYGSFLEFQALTRPFANILCRYWIKCWSVNNNCKSLNDEFCFWAVKRNHFFVSLTLPVTLPTCLQLSNSKKSKLSTNSFISLVIMIAHSLWDFPKWSQLLRG